MISGKDTPAKRAHTIKLTEFLVNPDNEWPGRANYYSILGISKQAFYQYFNKADLTELENDALALRRKQHAQVSARIDSALAAKAAEGDVAAIKLYKQVVEGWGETNTTQLSGVDGRPLIEVNNTEVAVKLAAVIEAAKERKAIADSDDNSDT